MLVALTYAGLVIARCLCRLLCGQIRRLEAPCPSSPTARAQRCSPRPSKPVRESALTLSSPSSPEQWRRARPASALVTVRCTLRCRRRELVQADCCPFAVLPLPNSPGGHRLGVNSLAVDKQGTLCVPPIAIRSTPSELPRPSFMAHVADAVLCR